MSTEVQSYEVEWDELEVRIKFVDEHGDGEQLCFSHEEFMKVADAITVANMEIQSQK